jgi:hypothetical protein
MSGQLVTFLVVWSAILLLFSVMGQIIFYEMIEFKDTYSTIITLLQASMGGWDMYPFIKGKKYSCSDGTITALNDCFTAPRLDFD